MGGGGEGYRGGTGDRRITGGKQEF